MKELTLEDPGLEKVREWNQEATSSFHEGNWIGRPDSSLELHLLSGTRPIEAQSFDRLEPLLDDLTVLGCFKDVSIEDIFEMRHDEEYNQQLAQIDREYVEQGIWEMSSYLQSVYEAVPSREVSSEIFSEEAEVSNLRYNTAVVEEIEDSMRADGDFSVTGVEMNVYSEGADPLQVYDNLYHDLFFSIYFIYGEDKRAIREYNEITDEWGDTNQYSGVPGVVNVGKDRPYAFFFESEELSIDGSRVDAWLYDHLDSNLGVRSRVRNRNN